MRTQNTNDLLINIENIFDAMLDGVYIINQQYEIQYLNKVLENEFGDYENRKCFEYFHEEDSICPWCKSADVFSGETIRWEQSFNKNKKIYDLIDTPFQNPDGSISKLSILRDVTEDKLAEERSQNQAERIRVFFNSLRDAILVHPLKEEGFAPFVEVNDIACERYGYSHEEFLQLSAPDITIKSDASSHSAPDHRKKLFDAGHLVFESVHIKKSGEKFPVEINANVIQQWGKPFVLAVVRDITERKRFEAQLRKVLQLESIATLSGGIAHEFNNALNVVSGHVELLQMELSDHENVRTFGKEAMDSIKRLTMLTDQLHAYARGGKYKAQTVNLSDFVRTALPIILPNIPPGINLDTNLSTDISDVKADPAQFQMVLSAILTNASEALEGKGHIHIVSGDGEIEEPFAANHPGIVPGRYVILTVEDDGEGMDEKTKSRIFDPFFTTKFQGRGLGMAAVYGIIKNHGGYVYVESELGKGTMVRILIPPMK